MVLSDLKLRDREDRPKGKESTILSLYLNKNNKDKPGQNQEIWPQGILTHVTEAGGFPEPFRFLFL